MFGSIKNIYYICITMGQTKKTLQDWVMEMYNDLMEDDDYQYEKYRERQEEAERAAYEEMLADRY